jgi:hypothetical protein
VDIFGWIVLWLNGCLWMNSFIRGKVMKNSWLGGGTNDCLPLQDQKFIQRLSQSSLQAEKKMSWALQSKETKLRNNIRAAVRYGYGY